VEVRRHLTNPKIIDQIRSVSTWPGALDSVLTSTKGLNGQDGRRGSSAQPKTFRFA